jgi:hypothetical protein
VKEAPIGPESFIRGDTNGDGKIDISDAIYILQFLFLGGPAPEASFPDAGTDPSEDKLGC